MVPGYLDRLDEAFAGDPVRWEGEVELRRRAQSLSRGLPREPVAPPSGLQATLRPYQEAGFAWLQNLRAHGAGGVLADDMGLGKTLQTIAHVLAEKQAGRMDRPTLVVAPTSLIGNWRRELAKFAPSLRVFAYHGRRRHQQQASIDEADVVLTTYPLVVRDAEVFEHRRFYMLVLDEAQAIKNMRSQAHRTVKGIDAELRLCLSGTPVENNLDELWALFDFIMPGLLGDAGQFRSAFRYPIERDGNEERLATLRDRVAPFVLRRMKDKVAAELPPKTEIVRPIELRGKQRDLYESIRLAAHATVRTAVRKKGIAASTIDILGALMKLRQACCDPRLVPVAAARDVENSAKFELLFEMLPELLGQERRILVFSQFTSMLALISQELARQRVPFVTLTGSTHDRQGAVDAFQRGQASVFLISLKAGGTGLNLTTADTVIHYDPWWNPAAQAQATDRAYRIGQTRPVFVYNLIVAGSVEERMLELQRRKQALADGLLAAGDHGRVELSEREVEDLFAPLEG
jgi:SNF2 family DNA or RNA helicase